MAADAQRTSAVAPAERSSKAKRKAARKRTDDDLPVHSFQTLLQDLATLTKNRVRFGTAKSTTATMLTSPTPVQQRALALLKLAL